MELDYGEWSGRTINDLANDPRWQRWNAVRSMASIPGGENMLEAQLRIVREIERIRQRHAGSMVAVVSHADVLRAAVAYFLAIPLDLFLRIEISPASVTTVELADWGPKLLAVNET